MSAFNGRWKLQSSENMKDYCKKMGLTDEAMSHVDVMEVTGENSEEHVKTITDKELKAEIYIGGKLLMSQLAPLGVESEVEGLGGIKYMCLTTLEGNTLTTKSVSPPEFCTVQTVDGDKLTMVMASGDVTCTRKYTKI